jgi:rod shape-determining protein MreC
MKRKNYKIKTKAVLGILTGICALLIAISVLLPTVRNGMKNAVSHVVTPIQTGINHMGMWFVDKVDAHKELEEALAENEKLQLQIDELTEENSMLVQNKYELERLRELFDLSDDYPDYEKVAAKVIAKESGNWFHSFTIDAGKNDGIEVDMNVISGGGLVGIVSEVGDDYAIVESIIDDGYNVSGKCASSSDLCIVNGDLSLMDSGLLELTDILKDSTIKEGDMILTSPISSKYLPGILIGYVTELSEDSNDLTKSGYLMPVVDFAHIEEVLVIKELKYTGDEK